MGAGSHLDCDRRAQLPLKGVVRVAATSADASFLLRVYMETTHAPYYRFPSGHLACASNTSDTFVSRDLEDACRLLALPVCLTKLLIRYYMGFRGLLYIVRKDHPHDLRWTLIPFNASLSYPIFGPLTVPKDDPCRIVQG